MADIVTLKDSRRTQIQKTLANAVMRNLELLKKYPTTLYELGQVYNDSTHSVWGKNNLNTLIELGLLEEDGTMDNTVRTVLEAAQFTVQGEGLSTAVSWESPYDEEDEE